MEVEIFVVDNHSQDDSLDYLIPRFPEVRFIANTENVGFARANNQAIEQSTGKYVLLLNPDTVIAENTLYEVFQFMEAHPEAGGTWVKMLDGDGRFLPESKEDSHSVGIVLQDFRARHYFPIPAFSVVIT